MRHGTISRPRATYRFAVRRHSAAMVTKCIGKRSRKTRRSHPRNDGARGAPPAWRASTGSPVRSSWSLVTRPRVCDSRSSAGPCRDCAIGGGMRRKPHDAHSIAPGFASRCEVVSRAAFEVCGSGRPAVKPLLRIVDVSVVFPTRNCGARAPRG
jgi:hypothetical protein